MAHSWFEKGTISQHKESDLGPKRVVIFNVGQLGRRDFLAIKKVFGNWAELYFFYLFLANIILEPLFPLSQQSPRTSLQSSELWQICKKDILWMNIFVLKLETQEVHLNVEYSVNLSEKSRRKTNSDALENIP